MRSIAMLRRLAVVAFVLCLGTLSAVPFARAQAHPTHPSEFALAAAGGMVIGNSAQVPAPIATNGELFLNDRCTVGDTYAGKYLRGRIRSSIVGSGFAPSGKIELSNLTSVSGNLFSDSSTVVGAFALVEGDVTTRSGTLRLARHAAVLGKVFAGDAFLGERDILVGDPDDPVSGDVDVKGDALIADRGEYFGDVRYEGNLRLVGIGDPIIHGALLSVPRGSFSIPPRLAWQLESIPKPNLDAGTQTVTVKREQVVQLSPGTYGALVVERDSSLELGAGAYAFASIKVEPEARIAIDLRAAPNAIEIRVNGRSKFGRRLRVDLTGDPSRVRFVAGESFSLGKEGTWYGAVHGFETVRFGKSVTLHGSAWSAGDLILGPYSDVDWVRLAP